jgi:hypothetical protein
MDPLPGNPSIAGQWTGASPSLSSVLPGSESVLTDVRTHQEKSMIAPVKKFVKGLVDDLTKFRFIRIKISDIYSHILVVFTNR